MRDLDSREERYLRFTIPRGDTPKRFDAMKKVLDRDPLTIQTRIQTAGLSGDTFYRYDNSHARLIYRNHELCRQ